MVNSSTSNNVLSNLNLLKSPTSPFYSPKATLTALREQHSNRNALSNIPILVTAFLAILATGGPTYSFGVYAATLKHSLSLTQSQLETLGAASFAAGFISWIPGLVVDGWGSRTAIMLGGLLQSIGLLVYWIVARFGANIVPATLIVPLLSLLSVLIFTSNNLVIGGVFKSIVVSCGLGTKGKAVGAAKAYLGMGAGVFASLFRSLPQPTVVQSDLDFLAMSSMTAIIAIVMPAFLLLPTNTQMGKKGTKDESTTPHYNLIYFGLFAVAIVVVGTSAMDLFAPSSNADNSNNNNTSNVQVPEWLHGLVIVLVWIGPILGLFVLPTQSGTLQEKLQRQQSVLRRKVRQAMERDDGEKRRLLPTVISTTNMAAGQNKQQYEQEDTTKDDTTNISATATGTTAAAAISIPQQPQASSRSIISFASDCDRGDGDGDVSETQEEELVDQLQETPQPIEDLTLLEMLQTLRAWLFLVASTILVGSGTMLTINMGQMVQSQQYAPEVAAAALSMFSVAQALARVASGAISEAALQFQIPPRVFGIARGGGVPRPAFLVLSCACAVVGHTILALYSSNLNWFVLGIVFTGFSFGALWPLMVLIVGDLFGTVNHGANYMFMDGFTCAVGTLSIAKFLTQWIYEQQLPDYDKNTAAAAGGGDDGLINPNACYGDECFRTTHIIIASLCMVSLLTCTVLLYMTRSSYGALI